MNFNKKISFIAVFSLIILASTFIFLVNQSKAYDASCVIGSYNPSDYCQSGCVQVGCNLGSCAESFRNGTLRQDGNYCCMAAPSAPSGGEVCASPTDLSYGCYEYAQTPILASQCYQCDQRAVCNVSNCPSPQYRCESGICIQPKLGGSSCGQASICGGTSMAGNGVCQEASIYISFNPPNIEVGQSTTYTINGYANALVNVRQTVNGAFFGSSQIRLNNNGVYTGSYTFQTGQSGTFITTVSYIDYPTIKNESRLIVREHPLASSLEIVSPRNFYTLPFNLTLKVRGSPNSRVLANAISVSNNQSLVILNDYTEPSWVTGTAGSDNYGEWTHTFSFSDNTFIGNWTIWVNVGGQISNQVSIQVARAQNIIGQSGQAQVSLSVSPSVIAIGQGVNVNISVAPSNTTFNQLRVWLSSSITGRLTEPLGTLINFSTPISSFVTLLNLAASGATSVNIGPGNWSISTAGVFYESAIFEVYVEARDSITGLVGRSNSAFFEVQPLGAINLSASYNSSRQTTQYLITSNYHNKRVYLWRWKNSQPEIQEELLGTTDSSGHLSVTVDQTCGNNTYLAYVVISGVGNSNSVVYDTPCSEGPLSPPTLDFWADSTSVVYNTGTTLRWSSSNTISCGAWGDWRGDKPLNGSEDTGNLTSSKTYNLNCSSVGGSVRKSVTVSVGSVPTNSPRGWHDMSDCNSSVGWACDANNYNQALDIHFYKDGPFGSGGVFIGSVSANQPREAAVGAECGGNSNHGFVFPTPNSLKDGVLHSIYAYAINIPSGDNPLLSDSPKTLTCSLPLGSFSLSLSGSVACNSVPLSWTAASGAQAYRILRGSPRVDISPYQPYTALNYTDATVIQNTTYPYQIEAYNSSGTNRSNTINVSTPYCPPTLNFSAAPTSIYQGQNTTLSWTTSYTTSCIASGGWSGSKALNGSQVVVPLPPPQVTYTLTCSGSGGSTSGSVTINIAPLLLPDWQEIIPR